MQKKHTVVFLVLSVILSLLPYHEIFGQQLAGHWQIVRNDSDYLSSDLYGLEMQSPVYGIAVGAFGTIRITKDSGNTWRYIKLPTEQTLRAVVFLGGSTAVCVGDSGVIYKSVDSGSVWQMINSGIATQLNGVAFADANTGVAVGANGKVLRTTNGGVQWSAQQSGITDTLYAVAFMGKQTVIAVGAVGTIVRSTNGGVAWSQQNGGVTDRLKQISKIDSTTLFAAGDNWAMLRTTDGGADWRTIKFDSTLEHSTAPPYMRAFAWADIAFGCVCMEFIDTTNSIPPQYFRYVTSNGGTSWNPIYEFNPPTPYGYINQFINELQFTSINKCVAVGDIGMVAVSRDSSTDWITQSSYQTSYGALSFSDPQNGYVLSGNSIRRTRDSGFAWLTVYDDTTYPNKTYNLNDIASPTSNMCVVVSDRDSIVIQGNTTTTIYYPPVILHTMNAGETWQRTVLPGGGSNAGFKISMCDSLHGVIGAFKVLYRTTNGGEAWDSVALPLKVQSQEIAPVFCIAPNVYGAIVEAYPDSTFFIKTVDDGKTWQIASLHIFTPFSIVFADPLNGWITGATTLPSDTVFIYHTNNGGKTWTLQYSDQVKVSDTVSMFDPRVLAFADKNNGIVGGSGTLVMRTTNGGVSWLLQNTGISNSKIVGSIAYPDYKYAIASDGTNILRYSGDTPLAVWEEAPENAALDEQVYPVPARQSDIAVRFTIPRQSSVTLSINDELGRTVHSVPEGVYGEGTYVKNVSLRGLPPGKYYATLTINGVAQTKALILLK